MLLDISVNRSSPADADMDVVRCHMQSGELLQSLGESRREEKIAMITIGIQVYEGKHEPIAEAPRQNSPAPPMIFARSSCQLMSAVCLTLDG